jgi:hypothetical protein
MYMCARFWSCSNSVLFFVFHFFSIYSLVMNNNKKEKKRNRNPIILNIIYNIFNPRGTEVVI